MKMAPILYDLFGILVILIFALRGARRGLVKELVNILSLLAALAFARPFGPLLEGYLPLQSFPAFLRTPLALGIGATVVYLFVRIFLSISTRWSGLDRHQEGTWKTALELGGAGMRGSIGLLFCVVTGWSLLSTGNLSALLLNAVPVMRDTPSWVQTLLLPLPFVALHSHAFSRSLLGQLSSQTNPFPPVLLTGTELLLMIAKKPESIRRLATSEPLRRITQLTTVQQLLQSEEIRALAAKQDVLGILRHPAVKQAMEDPEVLEELKQIDPEELKKFLAK